MLDWVGVRERRVMERSMEEGRGGREGGIPCEGEFGGRGSSALYPEKERETGGAVRGSIGTGRIPVSERCFSFFSLCPFRDSAILIFI